MRSRTGGEDKVLPPNTLDSKAPTSNQEPTLSGAKPHGRRGQGFASEHAGFEGAHVQSGTDLVGCEAARAERTRFCPRTRWIRRRPRPIRNRPRRVRSRTGGEDKVLPPNTLDSKTTTSNQEPTSSGVLSYFPNHYTEKEKSEKGVGG